MKLPLRPPRLSRKQKVVRNLLVGLLLALLAWAAEDFSAPTADIALRWRAEEHGLSTPEVLYRTEWENGVRDVVFRTDGLYGTSKEHRYGLLWHWVSPFQMVEPEEPVFFLYESKNFIPQAVYVYADLPDDARAVCVLWIQDTINGRLTDVTCTMEAEPSDQGIYRFILERNDPDNGRMDEELLLWQFQCTARKSGDMDLTCRLDVTFYDAGGNEVHAYEKEIWTPRR